MELSGSGTEADPWTIGSALDLVEFGDNNSYWGSGTFTKLTADIEMPSGYSSCSGGMYSGTFDGDGHTISNGSKPMFHEIEGATIKNLCLSNMTLDETDGFFGILVEYDAYNSTIEKCCVINSSIGNAGSFGILCGNACVDGSGTTIRNCYASGCTASTSSSYGVGSMIGYGLVSSSTGIYVENCYAYNFSGYSLEGSIVGFVEHMSSGQMCNVSNCASYGVSASYGSVAHLDSSSIGNITNCYYNPAEATFKSQSFWQTTLGWDFTNTWYWDATDNLPKLKVFQPVTAPAIRYKVSNAWLNIDSTYVKINGEWKEIETVFTKVNGEWKQA